MHEHLVIQLAQSVPLWVLQHVPTAAFVFCFGACVGSFMNVVVYRLPAGCSVIAPPSRCPTCGAMLSWRENLPIVGWLMLRGRCKHCGVPISPQYVMVELFMALLFLGLYVVLFTIPPSAGWWGQVGGPWWYYEGLFRMPLPGGAWPSFIAISFMLAGLVGMTIIDAKTYTIPIQIPTVVTIVGFAAAIVQGMLPRPPAAANLWPIPLAGWAGIAAAGGAAAGLLLAYLLLKAGVLRHSFADYHEYVNEGETLGDYPHGRREMIWELLYLLPCVVGLVIGGWIGSRLPDGASAACTASSWWERTWVSRRRGDCVGDQDPGDAGVRPRGNGDGRCSPARGRGGGSRVAGGAVGVLHCPVFWARMGGAVDGVAEGCAGVRRELPFGPHLAVATAVVVICRPGLAALWLMLIQRP